MKSPTDWMPAERHKRSQKARALFTLVDEAMTAVDAFIRLSSLVVLTFFGLRVADSTQHSKTEAIKTEVWK